MNIAIRGWKNRVLVFEEFLNYTEDTVDLVAEAAMRHADLIGNDPHMIEIEFLDEPDPLQRFFRFGTDASGMVRPIGFRL